MRFPAGFSYQEEFLTRAEEAELINRIRDVEMVPTTILMHGKFISGSRLQKYYGYNWNWETREHEWGDAMPDWLLQLREKVAKFADIAPASLVQGSVLNYEPGVKANYHRDKDRYKQIVGVSLGSSAEIAFRRPAKGDAPDVQHLINAPRSSDIVGIVRQKLNPRSIYRLIDEIREEWMHEIGSVTETRWSIMFRDLREPVPR